jgi:hypothetical protein
MSESVVCVYIYIYIYIFGKNEKEGTSTYKEYTKNQIYTVQQDAAV